MPVGIVGDLKPVFRCPDNGSPGDHGRLQFEWSWIMIVKEWGRKGFMPKITDDRRVSIICNSEVRAEGEHSIYIIPPCWSLEGCIVFHPCSSTVLCLHHHLAHGKAMQTICEGNIEKFVIIERGFTPKFLLPGPPS